jgi:gas vesicle protein
VSEPNNGYSGSQLLIAFLAGAAAGAAVALLTAPQSGKETREKVKRWAHDLEDKAAHLPAELKQAYGRATDAAKGTFAKAMRDERGTEGG